MMKSTIRIDIKMVFSFYNLFIIMIFGKITHNFSNISLIPYPNPPTYLLKLVQTTLPK